MPTMPGYCAAGLFFAESRDLTQLLAEGAGTLILLAAAIFVSRSFRERYLGIWISGWVLYSIYREAAVLATILYHKELLAGIPSSASSWR